MGIDKYDHLLQWPCVRILYITLSRVRKFNEAYPQVNINYVYASETAAFFCPHSASEDAGVGGSTVPKGYVSSYEYVSHSILHVEV